VSRFSELGRKPIPADRISFAGEVLYQAPLATAFERVWELEIGVVDQLIHKIAGISLTRLFPMGTWRDQTSLQYSGFAVFFTASPRRITVGMRFGTLVMEMWFSKKNALLPPSALPPYVNVFLTSARVQHFVARA